MRPYRGIRVDNGEWVYGYYCEVQGRHIIIPSFKDSNSEIRPFISGQNGIHGYHEVIPETVGQSTGRKDKNDTEIYEGDIVQTKYETMPPVSIMWRDGGFYYSPRYPALSF